MPSRHAAGSAVWAEFKQTTQATDEPSLAEMEFELALTAAGIKGDLRARRRLQGATGESSKMRASSAGAPKRRPIGASDSSTTGDAEREATRGAVGIGQPGRSAPQRREGGIDFTNRCRNSGSRRRRTRARWRRQAEGPQFAMARSGRERTPP